MIENSLNTGNILIDGKPNEGTPNRCFICSLELYLVHGKNRFTIPTFDFSENRLERAWVSVLEHNQKSGSFLTVG